MTKLTKKRQVVMAVLIVALAAAVFVNWYYTAPDTTPVSGLEPKTDAVDETVPGEAQAVGAEENAAEDYFASVRLQRDTARDEALGNIQAVMANLSDADEQVLEDANANLDQLSEQIKQESDIEALVSAKLGTDCVAVMNGEAIQIVVPQSRIDETSVLQITEIVLDNTDIKSDSIKIIGAE